MAEIKHRHYVRGGVNVSPGIRLWFGVLLLEVLLCASDAKANFFGGTLRAYKVQFIDDAMYYGVQPYYFRCLSQLRNGAKTDSAECKLTIEKFNEISRNMDFGVIRSDDRQLLLDLLLILKNKVDSQQ